MQECWRKNHGFKVSITKTQDFLISTANYSATSSFKPESLNISSIIAFMSFNGTGLNSVRTSSGSVRCLAQPSSIVPL